MRVTLVDGPLDRRRMIVDDSQKDIIIAAIPSKSGFEKHRYFRWNDSYHIYMGKGANVERFVLTLDTEKKVTDKDKKEYKKILKGMGKKEVELRFPKNRYQPISCKLFDPNRLNEILSFDEDTIYSDDVYVFPKDKSHVVNMACGSIGAILDYYIYR